MKKIIIAYIPVFHEGYRQFLEKHKDADVLYILDKDLIENFRSLVKDIRAVSPKIMLHTLDALHYFNSIKLLNAEGIKNISTGIDTIVMPDEDVMHELHTTYFPEANVIFDTVFLRWDKNNSLSKKEVTFDGMVSIDEKDKDITAALNKLSEKSSDWWRQVGAAVVKNGEVVIKAYNHHLPSDSTPYVVGDPRASFNKGVHVELTSAIHAEASVVAEAASEGISLKGASIYVTTFPCPACAKLIACSGIKKLYYAEGYAMLDGQDVLKDKGIELIFVDTHK